MPTNDALRVAAGFTLPVDYASRTAAVLAMKGAGKSNVGVVLAEEMHRAGVPWVAVDPKGDWWGIRSSRDGRSAGLNVPVLGGDHGDLPLDPASGAVLADLVVKHDLTCVLDVSAFTKGETVRFLTAFFTRLLRTNTTVRHLFLEEADEYVPQRHTGDLSALVGATERLVKRGRFRGLGMTMLTQRSASLNKDVLTQIDTLIALRTPAPQDRKAIKDWVDVHAGSDEMMDSLPVLPDGEGWVSSPQWLAGLTRVKFRRRATFDSGATPVHGQARTASRVADVDLDVLREQMAASIEKAKQEDPKHLRAEVARLTRALADTERDRDRWREKAEAPRPEVDVRVHQAAGFHAGREQARAALRRWLATAEDVVLGDTSVPPVQTVPVSAHQASPRTAPKTTVDVRKDGASIYTDPPAPRPRVSAPVDGVLGKAERLILTVLAQQGPTPKKTVAVMTGYAHSGGGFGNALGALRSKGYLNRGEPLTATPEGLDALGPVDPLPTGQELIDFWKAQKKVGKAAGEILDVLTGAYPAPMSKEQVAAATASGYEPNGGGFGNAIGTLRTLGLIEGPGNALVATGAVMGVT